MLSEGSEHTMTSKEQTEAEAAQHSMTHQDLPEDVESVESFVDNSEIVKSCGNGIKTCECRRDGYCKYFVLCLALFLVFYLLKE